MLIGRHRVLSDYLVVSVCLSLGGRREIVGL